MGRKSIKQSLKNIFRLSFLLFLKETWLLFSNIIGLIYHPFLTLRKIRQKHDLSQVGLIVLTILLPLITVLFTTGVIYLAMVIFGLNFPNLIKQTVILANVFAFAATGLAIVYLAYWSYQVITKNHYSLFVEEK